MIVLSGADIVLPDRLLPAGSIVIEGERIAAIEARVIDPPAGAVRIDVTGGLIAPGFVDVHVHGVEGHDVLDGPDAVREVAMRLPAYGVTAFCPTSVACSPETLAVLLRTVSRHAASGTAVAGGQVHARVVAAHLESNFINPEYSGAQPLACLRTPRPTEITGQTTDRDGYSAREILDTIAAYRAAVGIVTLAPELAGGLDLVRDLRRSGHIVSIGHSGASYEEARDAIDAGVTHATHLFNRMTPMSHRAPGVPGAVLESDAVRAELICDGFHVHPALMRLAIRARGCDGIMAITDGTAGSGLPVGARARLGGRTIVVTPRTAELEDGTLAGSVLTMDAAFRLLVHRLGISPVDAAVLCSTTPARQLGLDSGRIARDAVADLVVLGPDLRVRHTLVAGRVWGNRPSGRSV